MSSVLPLPARSSLGEASRVWLISLAGYAAMYGPGYWWAGNTIWQSTTAAVPTEPFTASATVAPVQ